MDDLALKNDNTRRLSIIDVSSEDDSLLGLAPGFALDDASSVGQEQRSMELFESIDDNKLEEFFEPVDAHKLGDFDDNLEKKGLVPQPSECLEPDRVRKNGKYNLRKSLAWDSAFFTCEGFLDSEELSSMIAVDKGQKQMLPGIQEEVHTSTDSISTLESDVLTLESVEGNLFEDIRASIQKSSKAVKMADESSKVGSAVRETKVDSTSKGVESASQPKMKPKVASSSRKPNIRMQNPGKLARPVSASPQFSQSVAATRESNLSFVKQPKVLDKPIPSSTMVAKRASMSGNVLKMEKDNVKFAAGRGALLSKLPGSLRNVPRPDPSSKSSSVASSTATTKGTTSSFASSGSSSVKFGKSPSNSIKRKTDARTGNPNSSAINPKTPSGVASRNKTESGNSQLSAQLMPSTKFSSSVSPASSISDWSSGSVSSISSIQQISCSSSRDSLKKSSCKRVSIDFDAAQSVDYQNHSNDQSAVGSAMEVTGLPGQCAAKASTGMVGLPPTSKPSGLRLPSPKIGFFDGVKSAQRTPKRSMQSHPAVPSNLPKVAAASASPHGNSVKAKVGKVNPERPLTVGARPDAQRTSSNVKPKISTLPETSKAAAEICTVSRNVESGQVTSPKAKIEMPSEIGQENYLKAEKVGNGDNVGLQDKDTGLVEKGGTIDVSKAEVTPEGKNSPQKEEVKICNVSEGNTAISDLSSISNVEHLTLSQQVVEDARHRELEFNHDLRTTKASNEKEESHSEEDLVACLTRQVKGMEIKGTEEMFEGDKSLSSHSQHKLCNEDNGGYLSVSPTTYENTSCTRIPFAIKDYLCNIDESFDLSKGSMVPEAMEKSSQFSSFSEEEIDTEQLR